jgi:SAM-dependent methyltransferase
VSFDVTADAYDQFMGRYSVLLSPQMVDFAQVRPGQFALDVGCGPGALTAELSRRLGPQGVSAVDPSESFVAAARARNPGVEVFRATAEDLPFADHSFDVVLAQLVVHFMGDPVTGLVEMARVARPGCVVAASVWDHAGGKGPLSLFWEAARGLDPALTDESELPGVRQGELAKLFQAADLRQVEETVLVADREYTAFGDWWEPFTHGVGPAGGYVAGMDEQRMTELREACRAMLPSGKFVIPARAWAVRGVSGPGH